MIRRRFRTHIAQVHRRRDQSSGSAARLRRIAHILVHSESPGVLLCTLLCVTTHARRGVLTFSHVEKKMAQLACKAGETPVLGVT